MLTIPLIMINRCKEPHYQNRKHHSLKIQYIFKFVAGLVCSRIV